MENFLCVEEQDMENLTCLKEIVLSGDKEIFRYIVGFENGLHKKKCIQFLEHTEAQRPEELKLRLKFLNKQEKCWCSEIFFEKVKGISNDKSETELVNLFKDDQVQRYLREKHYNDEDIVFRWVSHLQDICIEKGFENLRSTLLVKDLSDYEEIFTFFLDFENGLHKMNCITFLPLSGAKEQMRKMPKLRLKLLDKKDECTFQDENTFQDECTSQDECTFQAECTSNHDESSSQDDYTSYHDESTPQDDCTSQNVWKCSEIFLDKVKGFLDDVQESKLVEIFEVYLQGYERNKNYNGKDIACRLVSHLQDICISKSLPELARALQITGLYGYKEIFHCFVDFEKLHTMNCITFLPLSGAKEQMRKMPKLCLRRLDQKDDCKCSENFLVKMKVTLADVQESKLVHIFKVYLQGYVRNQNNYDKDIACRLVSHLQDICITKSLPELARYCFQTNMTAEKLMQILTERFEDLTDKITAVVISEMDSKSVLSTFSSSKNSKYMKTIMKDRSETLIKLMEKLVKHTDQKDKVKCKILEMDDKCRTPDQAEFNFFSYTVFQQIAYRGMEEVVCSRAYQCLTKEKWENWCRRAFARDAVIYLISIALLTFVAVTSVNAPNVVVYQSPLDYTRAIFEIVLLLYAACIFVIEIYQAFRLKKEYFVDKMNIVEITSPVLLLLLLPLRYIHEQTHWYIYAVTYLVWFLQIVKYAPVFKFTGVYVDSLQKMFVKDILRFGIVLFITIFVFSGTFLLVLKAENTLQLHEETMSFWKIGIVGIRIMIESDSIVEYTGDDGYKFAGAMVMMVFMFFIIVVLVNMLIAQLINTYQDIESTSLNGFRVRQAKIVARLEREHMPFPFNMFKKDNKRKSCYKMSLPITEKVKGKPDTGIIHDDSLTIQQNIEDRLKGSSNMLEKLNSSSQSLVKNLCSLLEVQSRNDNRQKNVNSDAEMGLQQYKKAYSHLYSENEQVKSLLEMTKVQLQSEQEKNKRLQNKKCFFCK